VGSLVGQLAETNERARTELAGSFDRWEHYLREGLQAMRARGELRTASGVNTVAG
jgi:TetR/AcrR family transcriptional repressor of nem operon